MLWVLRDLQRIGRREKEFHEGAFITFVTFWEYALDDGERMFFHIPVSPPLISSLLFVFFLQKEIEYGSKIR